MHAIAEVLLRARRLGALAPMLADPRAAPPVGKLLKGMQRGRARRWARRSRSG
ncbi:hypothetical protein ACIBKY_09525 [Nonomuraea sp. NPDC050394]|uniref:hypothetical protein n=1 Tax=Nonomuraea sp. NPDC050394 TaxID=3364363 RepID=UPI0037B3E9AD